MSLSGQIIVQPVIVLILAFLSVCMVVRNIELIRKTARDGPI